MLTQIFSPSIDSSAVFEAALVSPCLRFSITFNIMASFSDFTEGAPFTPVDIVATGKNHSIRYDMSDGWNKKRRNARVLLSFRYEFTMYLRNTTISSYVEVENILNHRDDLYEYFSLGEHFGDGKIVSFKGRGILPVGGVQITF